MRKRFRYLAAIAIANIISFAAFAQMTTISGTVKNSVTSEVVSAASVTVKGSGAGTFTDDKGNFKLSTTQKFPLTLIISSIGFEMQEVAVNSSSDLKVDFKPTNILGQEVVIAATLNSIKDIGISCINRKSFHCVHSQCIIPELL